MQAEVRYRKMWKDDFQAALRGQLNDLLSHVETHAESQIGQTIEKKIGAYLEAHERSVRRAEELVSSDREWWDAYRKNFNTEVRGIVLEVLKDFYVINEDGNVLGPDQR